MGSSAEKLIDADKLQENKIHALSLHEPLIAVLDRWILSPDKTLLPGLRELASIVKQLYKLNEKVEVFRGFDQGSRYQNAMGTAKKGFFFISQRTLHVGDKYPYTSAIDPISFTTDLNVARGFGPTVVSTVIDLSKADALVITDELSYMVSQRRNIAPVTQKEIILLPPIELEFEVIERKGKSHPDWVTW